MGLMTDRNGGPLDSFLRSIPGYAGYAAKERRRDADRALRTLLARRLTEVADGLQRLERDLTVKGELHKLPAIERALQRVQFVADRLSTTTYGYAPLFDAAVVREEALDQLYAFDAALAGHVEAIEGSATALAGAVGSGADVEAPLAALLSAVEELNRQIDRRAALITEQKLMSPPELSELLAKRPQARAVASQIQAAKPGDAVSVEGVDYLVKARISYREPAGEASVWLFDGSEYLWLELMGGGLLGFGPEEPAPFPANAPDVYSIGGVDFLLQVRSATSAEVLSDAGRAEGLPVERLRYVSGDKVLMVERWRSELKVKVLRVVDPGFVQVWAKTEEG